MPISKFFRIHPFISKQKFIETYQPIKHQTLCGSKFTKKPFGHLLMKCTIVCENVQSNPNTLLAVAGFQHFLRRTCFNKSTTLPLVSLAIKEFRGSSELCFKILPEIHVNTARDTHPVLWGVYTLAGPTFIISLFLDRLGVTTKSAIRLLFVAACCFCFRV